MGNFFLERPEIILALIGDPHDSRELVDTIEKLSGNFCVGVVEDIDYCLQAESVFHVLVELSAQGKPFGIETLLQSIEQLAQSEFQLAEIQQVHAPAQNARRAQTPRFIVQAHGAPRAISWPCSVIPLLRGGHDALPRWRPIQDCAEFYNPRNGGLFEQDARPALFVQRVEEPV